MNSTALGTSVLVPTPKRFNKRAKFTAAFTASIIVIEFLLLLDGR